ncbi:MAG: hypothetical protein HYS34_07685 [Acidobacteria bacterium]|nr:hypothetical protein [Acidobacteriota bacterium]
MKKILVISALLLGIAFATPALADHRGHHRGHRVVRGGYHHVYHSPYRRHRANVYFRAGGPAFAFGFYAPAPAYYFEAAPVLVEPGYCHPVWVPGHYVRDRGARVWIAGHWSR